MMLEASDVLNPTTVCDFAVGDGSLLLTAAERWKNAALHGFDIDRHAIKSAAKNCGYAKLSVLDFLNDERHKRNRYLKPLKRNVDLILLNPPFTCRGNARVVSLFQKQIVSSSLAAAFVLRALDYLAPAGELLAIVPQSCLSSIKDNSFRRLLAKNFQYDIIASNIRSAFKHYAVSVAIIRIRHQTPGTLISDIEAGPLNSDAPPAPYGVTIMRGSLPVQRLDATGHGVPVIHSTNLKEGSVVGHVARSSKSKKFLEGQAVLIPRVGRFSVGKICLKEGTERVVLSDCVIALQTAPSGYELELFKRLIDSWSSLSACYSGSCAPYTTLPRIRELLRLIGCCSEQVTQMCRDPSSMVASQYDAAPARAA